MAEPERPVIHRLVLLLGPTELEPCAGDVDCFAEALRRAIDDRALSLPTAE